MNKTQPDWNTATTLSTTSPTDLEKGEQQHERAPPPDPHVTQGAAGPIRVFDHGTHPQESPLQA